MNEDFYDDSQIGLEVDGKRWAGRNYGFQSEESYNKLYVQGKLNPAQQAIERATSSIAGLPGIKQGLEFIGGATRFAYQQLPSPVQQAVEFGLAKNQEAAENIAAATGLPVALTDPTTIADVVTGGATLAVKPGLKKAVRETVESVTSLGRNLPPPGATPQLAMAGVGSPQLTTRGGGINLNPQAMPITVDPKFRAPGMVQDVAQQPEFRGALDRRQAALEDVQQNIARREAQGKAATKYKKELAGKGSTLDYDPNDPIVFEKNRYKVYDPLDPQRTAHQHHLFAKAQSYPFVEKMEELIAKGVADEDDLVNMFAWADMLDVTMGNTRKNMLDAPGRSHISAAPGSTQFDKSRNIHTLLKEFDLEISGKQVRELVKDANNATELMDKFNNYIVQSVKPQKAVAQRIVEDFLARHRAQLPKDQLALFDDLSSKLGGRYKQ